MIPRSTNQSSIVGSLATLNVNTEKNLMNPTNDDEVICRTESNTKPKVLW